MHKKNILFSICSLGLGHASRSLPLIKKIAKNNKAIILSDGNALRFLKEELKLYKNVKFYEKRKKYPTLEEGNNFWKYNYCLIKDSILTYIAIKKENKQTKEICEKEKVNIIISDGNYGSFNKKIPSFLISHQIEFQIKNPIYKKISSLFNENIFNKYDKIIIPDYEGEENISGELSHNKLAKKLPHVYAGVLSQFKKLKLKNEIKYLIIISGFLHEHKEEFFLNTLKELKKKKGKKVFIMGDYDKDYKKNIGKDIEIYSSFKGLNKNRLFNSSEIIISRTGYTTLMDLIEIGKKAILVPTPKQSEQEYLGEYHLNKNLFNIIKNQKEIKINFKKLKSSEVKLHKTKESIRIILEEINKIKTNQNDS